MTEQPEHGELFANMIRRYKIGSEVELSIVRDGAETTIKTKLQARPTPAQELAKHEDHEFEFTAREISFGDRADEKLAETTGGVFIQSVQSASWAALAGLRAGDILLAIDAKSIGGIEDLKKRMSDIRSGRPKRVVFFIRRGIHTGFIELEPDWGPAEN